MNTIEKINTIDELFIRSLPEDQNKMMECLDDPVTRSYFIRKLSNKFDPMWFEFAYNTQILSFSDIPEAIKSEDSDGRATLGFKNWEGAFPIVEAAKSVSKYPNLINLLVKIIDEFISLAKEEKDDENRNFTVDYHISKAILLLPINLLKQEQLEFVFDFGLRRDRSLLSREIVNSFFSRVIEESKNLTIELLDRFYTPIFEKRMQRLHSVVDDYALENFSKIAPETLYRHFGNDVVQQMVERLKKLSSEHKFLFSKIELTSLEPDEQNSNETDFRFSLVRMVIALLSMMPKDNLETELARLINVDDQIMSRIAYYLIDRNYSDFGHLFWENDNPLDNFEAKLEIYRLIERHCEEFTSDQIDLITNWIHNIEVDKSEGESKEQHERYKAYRQLEWFLGLERVHYKYSDQLIQPFNKLKEICGGSQPSHPGYDSYFTVRHGGDYSSSNSILGKSAVDVLNILANKEKWDGYNIYGLQQDLREFVISSHNEVANNINKFEALPIPFIYNFVDGFRGLAEKGASMNITDLLGLFRLLIENRVDLWDLSTDDREKSGAIGMIAWTIKSLVRNYDNSLTIEQIKSAIESLIIMEAKYTGAFDWLNNDPINDIINSSRGHIYDAMITCSIREVKLKGGEPFWDECVKSVFTKRLVEKSGSTEFYWSLGFNVPQISYLEIDWLKHNHDLLVEVQEGDYQLPVFYGYILFSTQLYTNLYELFYTTYLSQIEVKIINSTIVRRLVEHVWVAFAIGLGGAKDLVDLVIDATDTEKLKFLVDRIKIEDAFRRDKEIRYVWQRVLPIAEKSSNKQLKNIAYEMVYFAELLQDFAASDLELFNRTISLEKADVNTYRLLKIVEGKLRDKKYEMAGQLLNLLLEKLSYDAYFDESKLIEIIETLYVNGFTQYADSIAIASVERRNFSIVALYNKFQHTL